MPLSLAHGLVGATLVAAVHPEGRRWTPLLLGAAIAISPDLDFTLVWGLGMRGAHRTFTHSFVTALAVTAAMWAIVGSSRWRVAAAYGLALASHGILDFAATRDATGVMLLWPLSTERFRLGLVGFAEMSPGWPLREILYWAAWEAVIFVPILLAVLLLRARAR